MLAAIAHRGPDDDGVWAEDNIGLGSKRLAIIDLSKAGKMPMRYGRAGKLVGVYNGEIYNFQELREKLVGEGYRFRSKTDTEVILALYLKYGEGCLKYLRGMFAIAIYDIKNKTLFMARDRLGKKPLKYWFDGRTFIFASELKAILTQKEVAVRPDFLGINHYLTFGYVPAPMTGFWGIQKLEPGHYLVLDLKTNSLSKQRYWHLDFEQKRRLSEDQWSKLIWEKIKEATKIRMIADVPIGAFLSGGVDSSAVVAAMAEFTSEPVRTFSIGYRDPTQDETHYAKIVADRFKTEHTTLRVEPESCELLPVGETV